MDLFSIDFTKNEIVFIRQTLDLPTISAKDAKFLAGLQMKIEDSLQEIEKFKEKEEQRKQKELEDLIKSQSEKVQTKK